MAETPREPIAEFTTPLEEMAMVMHETYSAFLSAGFREDQAMDLIIRMAEFGIEDGDWDGNG
jgi:hypothetical protein